MVQEQWKQLQMKFLLGYNINIVIYMGELTYGSGWSTGWGTGIFPGGGMSKFLPHLRSRENPALFYFY